MEKSGNLLEIKYAQYNQAISPLGTPARFPATAPRIQSLYNKARHTTETAKATAPKALGPHASSGLVQPDTHPHAIATTTPVMHIARNVNVMIRTVLLSHVSTTNDTTPTMPIVKPIMKM